MKMLTLCCIFVVAFASVIDGYIGNSVSIRYPKIPGLLYPSNTIRKWKLKSDVDSCMEFKLNGLHMENCPSCSRDYLSVYDGDSPLAEQLLKSCGTPKTEPPAVRSTSNLLYVIFNSDRNDDRGKGFEATVTVVSCGQQQQQQLNSMYDPPSLPVCGKPPIAPIESGLYTNLRVKRQDGQSRIVGGAIARSHSWPWQVSIRFGGLHICGGSLVSPRYIISAAHCFKGVSTDPNDFEFYVGKHHKEDREEDSEQLLIAQYIYVHKNYEKSGKHDSDIALIRLRSPGARFTRFVHPICLPSSQSLTPEDRSTCYVSGFGKTKGTGGDSVLKQAAVPVVDNDRCKEMDRRIQPLLTERMLCAGYKGGKHDSCQGDSGGPLVCKIGPQDTWVLSGVVSFGFGCAGESSPGVYVRTTEFLPWFKRYIHDLPK